MPTWTSTRRPPITRSEFRPTCSRRCSPYSRMSGWTAHVLEQYHNNRLIRPRAEYKGNPDGMSWIPIEKR